MTSCWGSISLDMLLAAITDHERKAFTWNKTAAILNGITNFNLSLNPDQTQEGRADDKAEMVSNMRDRGFMVRAYIIQLGLEIDPWKNTKWPYSYSLNHQNIMIPCNGRKESHEAGNQLLAASYTNYRRLLQAARFRDALPSHFYYLYSFIRLNLFSWDCLV